MWLWRMKQKIEGARDALGLTGPGLQTLTWHHVTEPYRTEGDETEVARRQGAPGLPETEQGSPKEDVGNDNHLGVICLDRFW